MKYDQNKSNIHRLSKVLQCGSLKQVAAQLKHLSFGLNVIFNEGNVICCQNGLNLGASNAPNELLTFVFKSIRYVSFK